MFEIFGFILELYVVSQTPFISQNNIIGRHFSEAWQTKLAIEWIVVPSFLYTMFFSNRDKSHKFVEWVLLTFPVKKIKIAFLWGGMKQKRNKKMANPVNWWIFYVVKIEDYYSWISRIYGGRRHGFTAV